MPEALDLTSTLVMGWILAGGHDRTGDVATLDLGDAVGSICVPLTKRAAMIPSNSTSSANAHKAGRGAQISQLSRKKDRALLTLFFSAELKLGPSAEKSRWRRAYLDGKGTGTACLVSVY